MTRLTRAESQAKTRAVLISTARDLFLADGYAQTSLERVAESAGFSKGAVYSNFKSKKELSLEVLDLIHTSKFAEVAELLSAPGSIEDRLDQFQSWAEKTLGDVGWTMLEFELFVTARDDEELRAALVSALGIVRGMVVGLLESTTASIGVTLPMPVEDAASSLLSLGIGLGIQRAMDPSISARLVTDGLRTLLNYAEAVQALA
ncbi:TetR/AcrR family transcriptional regulator [Antrihabitans sp. NCIMB 15449]|uniref:TetR/AcrR family transcriptional regulator n=1 Tax=Antrihabitans spumae TaxID=3373370 RepID=A0ABW7JVY3_9NOCA